MAALIAVGAAFLPASASAGAECKVMDFAATDLIPGVESATARTVVQTVRRSAPNAIAGTTAAAKSSDSPPRDAADAIRLAIRQRDLQAFLRILPADPGGRQEALRKSFALDWAFMEAALPIVRQILRWDPAALAERRPDSNTHALQAVANEWSAIHYFATHGTPVDNPPAESDFPQLVQLLLKAGASADGDALDWRPPLGIVASLPVSAETTAAADLLLKAGAQLEAPHPGAEAPLVFAAEAANGEIARRMLGARRAAQGTLDEAVSKTPITGTNAVLPMLLEAGADINTRGPPGGDPRSVFAPAQRAATRFKFDGERELVELLIRYRADPNRLVNPGLTESPLMLVAPDVGLMSGLLEIGADPNYRNNDGDTALLLVVRAAEPGAASADASRPGGPGAPHGATARYGAVEVLLQHGADASATNKAGSAPLKATGAGDAAIVSLLMAHGGTWQLNDADLAIYRQQQVPVGRISWAALHQNDALGAAMLAHGERPTADDCGVLYYAAATGSDATLAALLERKAASYRVRDLEGHTPLMSAALHGRLGAVRLLLDSRVAEVDERTPRRVGMVGGHGPPAPALLGGASSLMLAAQLNRVAVAEELIRRGADVDAHDFGGRTPLDYATFGYGRDVVAVLKAHGGRN